MPPIHLDRFYHQPNTDWEPRPAADCLALHAAAIQGLRWVMDGNPARCLPQRLARATGLILRDVPAATSLIRYLRRTWFERDRHGTLEGGRDSVKWAMIGHSAITTPANRRRYAGLFEQTDLPKLRLGSPRALARFYRQEGLSRRPAAAAGVS